MSGDSEELLRELQAWLEQGQRILKAYQPKNSKTSLAYWRRRLKRPLYTENGEHRYSPNFAVCISARGERRNISLMVGDLDVAAEMARDFYVRVQRDGWAKALLWLRPALLVKRPKRRPLL